MFRRLSRRRMGSSTVGVEEEDHESAGTMVAAPQSSTSILPPPAPTGESGSRPVPSGAAAASTTSTEDSVSWLSASLSAATSRPDSSSVPPSTLGSHCPPLVPEPIREEEERTHAPEASRFGDDPMEVEPQPPPHYTEVSSERALPTLGWGEDSHLREEAAAGRGGHTASYHLPPHVEEAPRSSSRSRHEEPSMPAASTASSNGIGGAEGGTSLGFSGWKISRHPEIQIRHLKSICALGKGQFGVVQRVLWDRGDAEPDPRTLQTFGQRRPEFALKIISRVRCRTELHARMLFSERDTMATLSHPFHVKLINTYKTSHKLFILMEYISGKEFAFYISDFGLAQPEACVFYAGNILLALEHMHRHKIIHRDIKPRNMLVGHDGYLKLCDYGFSRVLDLGERTSTMVGTFAYMSPEVCQKTSSYHHSADLWAWGICIFEMCFGYTPFEPALMNGVYREATTQNIVHMNLEFPEHLEQLPGTRELLSRLLHKHTSHRLGEQLEYGEIKMHPFFTELDWRGLEDKQLAAPLRHHQQET